MTTPPAAAERPLTQACAEIQQRCERATDATLPPVPFTYAYKYHGTFGGFTYRMNHGEEVNGGRPVEAIPLYTAEQLTAAITALIERNAELERERDSYARETSDLRQGITKAIGMGWHKMPSGGAVCPDDKDIVAACVRLAGLLAGAKEAKEALETAEAFMRRAAAVCEANNPEFASGMYRAADNALATLSKLQAPGGDT